MFGLAFFLLLLTMAAAIFAFGAVVPAGVAWAYALFWVFLALLIIVLFAAAAAPRGPRRPIEHR